MRETVQLFGESGPQERLGAMIAQLPVPAQQALQEVAGREDLPLIAGSWQIDDGGCLLANIVRIACPDAHQPPALTPRPAGPLPIPRAVQPDLNRLIVAWDEAAAHIHAHREEGDAALRRLLRGALACAGV